jgi:ribosome maturation factor RimP
MLKNEIQQLIEPVVVGSGYQLWACEFIPQGKHSLLRVYIDKEGGIGLSDCEYISKQISALLDVEDPIKTNYSLEISSPGIPRPLFCQAHYQQYLGHAVEVKSHKVLHGNRKFTGIIQSVNDNAVIIDVQGEQVELQFSQIVKAHLIGE